MTNPRRFVSKPRKPASHRSRQDGGRRLRRDGPVFPGLPIVPLAVTAALLGLAVCQVPAAAGAGGSVQPIEGDLSPGPENVAYLEGGEIAPDPGEEEAPTVPDTGDGGGTPAPSGEPGASGAATSTSQTTVPGPVLLVDRWRSRVSRRARIVITGTAEHASGIARVRYTLARRVHGEKGSETDDGCRYLERRRRFTEHPWPCDALRNFRTARGTTTWTATMPRRLQRGRYIFAAQAQAANGEYSPVKRVRFRVVG